MELNTLFKDVATLAIIGSRYTPLPFGKTRETMETQGWKFEKGTEWAPGGYHGTYLIKNPQGDELSAFSSQYLGAIRSAWTSRLSPKLPIM